jgi:F420-non-reducing hydrogenase iron-sulfur subunit
LNQIGLESKRIEMFNLSSAMGPQFAQMAEEMVQRIDELGPSPLREHTPGATAQVEAFSYGGNK